MLNAACYLVHNSELFKTKEFKLRKPGLIISQSLTTMIGQNSLKNADLEPSPSSEATLRSQLQRSQWGPVSIKKNNQCNNDNACHTSLEPASSESEHVDEQTSPGRENTSIDDDDD